VHLSVTPRAREAYRPARCTLHAAAFWLRIQGLGLRGKLLKPRVCSLGFRV
jgi:hypothetical protein